MNQGGLFMYETQEDFQRLQTLIDQSIEQAGTFLRRSFQMPLHSFSARQLVHFWQGMQTVAFATVTSKGEPRVAPIDALLVHGHFYIPTVATAIRTRHILRNPAVSFTCYQGEDVAVIVHGEATVIYPDHPDFAALEALHLQENGQGVRAWGEGVFLQITPKALYSFARYPERHPED
jgi:hypothetical protein